MGKGDKKSKKGKLIMGSFGVKRQSRKQTIVATNIAVGTAVASEKPKKEKKVAKPKAKA
jgi:30S ribosomal protein S31